MISSSFKTTKATEKSVKMRYQLIICMFFVLFLFKEVRSCVEGAGGAGGGAAGLLSALTGGAGSQDSGGEEAQKGQQGTLDRGQLNCAAFH